MVVLGLFALRFPVYISDFDQWGWQIKCGTGLVGDLRQASDATNGSFVGSCQTALLLRRLWAVPLVVIGAAAFIGMLLATALASLHESLPAPADSDAMG
jgi:signal transduction histidine kinase